MFKFIYFIKINNIQIKIDFLKLYLIKVILLNAKLFKCEENRNSKF